MKKKLTFSLFFIFLYGLTNAINIAADGLLFEKFAMQTESFFSNIELWRIFTFSFFTNSMEGFVLFLFTFIFISNKIEQFLGNRIFPIFIILITFLTGTITTITMIKENVSFGGLEGTSFFIISIYVMLSKNNFIRNNTISLNFGIITSLLIWFGIKYLIATEYGFINIIPSFVMASCGIFIALLIFLQINYLVKKRIKEQKAKVSNKSAADFVGYSIYANPSFRKYFYEKIDPKNYWLVKEKIGKKTEDLFAENLLTDEEKLDKILDKINQIGQANLTKEEVKFLNKYSNKLQ